MKAMRNLISKCADCGEPFEDAFENDTGITLAFLCDACAEKRDQAMREREKDLEMAERREKLLALKRRTYGAEDLPRVAMECTFKRSDPKVEAMNPEPWKALKGVPKGNVWLYGPPGIGKTYLAYAHANRMLARGCKVVSTSAVTIERMMFMPYNDYDAQFKRLSRPDLLIIDDIDKAGWSEKGIVALWSILDELQRNKRKVLVTANVGFKGLVESMYRAGNKSHTTAIFERLQPISDYRMEGKSLRRKN